MTNFGFVAGDNPAYRIAKGLFQNTTNTELIPDSKTRSTISDLLNHLEVTTTITKPIENILLATHGSNEGWFELGLDFNTPKNTHFDDLTAAESAKSIFIKAPLIDPTLPPITVQFHGCRIGQVDVFMDQLKKTFGGNVLVSAPKVFDSVAVHTLTPAKRRGGRRPKAQTVAFMESLVYDFTVVVKDKFTKKADLVTAFHDKAQAGNFELMDSTPPPDDWWNDWIPTRIHQKKFTTQVKVPYGQTLQPIKKDSFPTEVVYAYRQRTFQIFDTQLPSAPSKESDRKDILRDKLNNLPEHPFPIHKRFGYESVDDFLDNITVPRVTKVKKNGVSGFRFNGVRHEYSLKVPVTDPATIPTGQTNPITANLVFDYYPLKSSGIAAVETIVFSDGPLFRII